MVPERPGRDLCRNKAAEVVDTGAAKVEAIQSLPRGVRQAAAALNHLLSVHPAATSSPAPTSATVEGADVAILYGKPVVTRGIMTVHDMVSCE